MGRYARGHGEMSMAVACIVMATAFVTACATQTPSPTSSAGLIPAQKVRSAIHNALGAGAAGPTVPTMNPASVAACKAVNGSFALNDNWSLTNPPAYKLYECDNVPYIGDDGSVYLVDLKYDSFTQLAPQSLTDVGAATHSECITATYPNADHNPGPGTWNAQLAICMPSASQIANSG